MGIEPIKQLWNIATNENNEIIKYLWYTLIALLTVFTILIKLWPFIQSSNLITASKKTLKTLFLPQIVMLAISASIAIMQPVIYGFLHFAFNDDLGITLYHFMLVISGITLMVLYFIVGSTRLYKKDFIYYDYTKRTKYNYQYYKRKRHIENNAFEKFFAYNYNDKQVKQFFKALKKYEKKSSDYVLKKVTNTHVRIHEFIILGSSYFLGLFAYYLYELPFKTENFLLILGIVLVLIIQINSLYILHITMKNYDHLKHYREEYDEDEKEG